MASQFSFFAAGTARHKSISNVPEGLRYNPALIDRSEEQELLTRVRKLPFKEFEFHGYLGKRRVVSFGWQYEFSGAGRLRKADDVPSFLLPLRERVATFARLQPSEFQHVLVIEYAPGAGIGWHRDRPVFGEVVGVSLLAPCVLRFRRKVLNGEEGKRERGEDVEGEEGKRGKREKREERNVEGERGKGKAGWERFNLSAEPRSAYHLSGPARSEWQHSILRVDELRYSITFRNMREL